MYGGAPRKPPPAPRCDPTTSLRLDPMELRAERLRGDLQGAGLLCLYLCWVIGGLVGAINGGGEPTENLIFLLVTAGVAIGGVLLLLAGSLMGRRTSDWWHPRMRETAPIGYLEATQRESTASRGSECEAKRRYRMAKRVRQQIRHAQIYERRGDGGGTLLTEPILVMHRRPRRDLAIFDQEGNQLGSVVRMQDSTSDSPGSAWISQVRDSQGRSVLAIRLAKRRRWPKSVPSRTGTYAVHSPDGGEIANIGQLTKAARTVTTGGTDPIARLDWGPALTISDAEGRQVAHITSNCPWYVLNCTAPVDEPLRRLVLAASIVWNDAGPESTS